MDGGLCIKRAVNKEDGSGIITCQRQARRQDKGAVIPNRATSQHAKPQGDYTYIQCSMASIMNEGLWVKRAVNKEDGSGIVNTCQRPSHVSCLRQR
jgi:hypothetical protein